MGNKLCIYLLTENVAAFWCQIVYDTVIVQLWCVDNKVIFRQ